MLNRERLSERLRCGACRKRASPSGGGSCSGERQSPALVGALHQQTEGNPFFLEEVLQYLVDEGVITRPDGRWQMAMPAGFGAPQACRRRLGGGVEHLAAESREALVLAAVIGPQFDFEVLLAASGGDEERLVGGWRSGWARGWWSRSPTEPRPTGRDREGA